MKIKITETGIVGWNGKPIEVGTFFTANGVVPAGWAGKYEIVEDDAPVDAQPIVNDEPEPEAEPEMEPEPETEIDEDLDDITALRDEYHEVTGGHADKRWKEDTLRDKIADAKKDDE